MTESNINVVTGENDLYARLIVPTQSDGATFSQSGTKVGGENFAVTSSSGTVEENSYEDYVTRFLVHDGMIEIGVLLNEGTVGAKRAAKQGEEPNRTIRISLNDVTDVRQEEVKKYPGIIFETQSDVYQLKFAVSEGGGLVGKNFETAPLRKAVSAIESQMAGPSINRDDGSNSEGTGAGGKSAVVEELQKLSDLHEKGALSDKEFQNAKDKLL